MDGIREYNPNTPDDELINEAYKLFEGIVDFESDARELMGNDIEFENGDTWGDQGTNRGIERRPALNVPRLNQFLNHIKNSMRQSKPYVKVIARGAKSEQTKEQRTKAADNRQGLLRFIQNQSQAVDAYQYAFDYAAGPGRGFIIVKTEYVSHKSRDQKIVIDYVPDPLDVYIDRSRKKLDYSDANHGFILTTMPKETFKKKYPKADSSHWAQPANGLWVQSDDITVAEFYCKWTKKQTYFELNEGVNFPQLKSGNSGYLEELKELDPEAQEEIKSQIDYQRDVKVPYMMWYKMTAYEILDRKPILGEWVPIIPVLGYERRVNGRVNIKGLTRDLKDLCKMYNYAASYEAEELSLSPRVKVMSVEGQLKGKGDQWARLNDPNMVNLTYKPVTLGGSPAPPPQFVYPQGVNGKLYQAKQGYVEDMKAVSGIAEPSLGMLGPERSGIALQELKRGSDIANMHYTDNMRIAITHIGKIVNSWLNPVYDTHQIVKILGEEEDEKEIELGGRDNDQDVISLGDEDYDVVVTMGDSYSTKRQASLDFMMSLIQAAPQVAPIIMDLVVKNSDAPGAHEIAERLKRTMDPAILEEQGGEKQLAMQLQKATQDLQQSGQMIQILTENVEKLTKELEDENKDRAKDVQIAQINTRGKIMVASINAKTQEQQKKADMYYRYMTQNRQSTQPGVSTNRNSM